MSKILITGGAGFIGSHIAEFLLKNESNFIRIVDNLSTGKMENIQFLLNEYKNLEFMYGDLTDLDFCKKAVIGIDIICHQAALGSVPRSLIEPLNSHNSNVNGHLNVLLAAREAGIKRVVYASSSSVYGDNPELPKKEENTGNVLSPYACTKAINEIYGMIFTKCYDMECIGLRYFNIFGPRQDPNGAYAAVIPKFINLMKQNKRPIINGDGSYSRDFTYIDNAVQANVLAMLSDNKDAYGEVFNIGISGQVTILDLFNIIKKKLKIEMEPIFSKKRPGDVPHSNASIDKAQKILGYNSIVSFEEGIIKTINSM